MQPTLNRGEHSTAIFTLQPCLFLRDLHGRSTLCIIVSDAAEPRTHWIASHRIRIVGPQHCFGLYINMALLPLMLKPVLQYDI
jgi:hypothetical protein